MHIVGFTIEIYRDARSYERQIIGDIYQEHSQHPQIEQSNPCDGDSAYVPRKCATLHRDLFNTLAAITKNQPILTNTTSADVTLRQNLFGMRHVPCLTRSARIKCGGGGHFFLMDRLSGFTKQRRVDHPFGRYFGLRRILVRRGFPGFSLASIGGFHVCIWRNGTIK
jgi:hypothetical protein